MVAASTFQSSLPAFLTYPSSSFFARFRGLMAFLGSLPAPGETEDQGGASAASSTTRMSYGPSPEGEGFSFPAIDERPTEDPGP